jgi:hypothetical protein
LTVDGQTLAATTVPRLPTVNATLVAGWSTTTVADGTHTLLVTATDEAGNASAVSRVVIVDNTPPDTVIIGGPIDATTDGPVTFTFTGTDNLTPPGNLLFAWRLDDGSYTEFASPTSATIPSLPTGLHAFEVVARDLAGNIDLTPAVATFTVGGAIQIRITSPLNGVTIPAGSLLVQGTVDPPGTGLGVLVNGIPAASHGSRFAALVPATPGMLVLTAVIAFRWAVKLAIPNTIPPRISFMSPSKPKTSWSPLTLKPIKLSVATT